MNNEIYWIIKLTSYAKQLIEDTIRRNASPVRLDAPQGGGSCSSLASSASDEAIASAAAAAAATDGNRNSQILALASFKTTTPIIPGGLPSNNNNNNGGTGLSLKMPRVGSVGQQLLHSLSTNDASLGEYKYTVGVGNHSVKITGDCFELVRVWICPQFFLFYVTLIYIFTILHCHRSPNWFLTITSAVATFWPRLMPVLRTTRPLLLQPHHPSRFQLLINWTLRRHSPTVELAWTLWVNRKVDVRWARHLLLERVETIIIIIGVQMWTTMCLSWKMVRAREFLYFYVYLII